MYLWNARAEEVIQILDKIKVEREMGNSNNNGKGKSSLSASAGVLKTEY